MPILIANVVSFPITAEIRAEALRANLQAIRKSLPAGTPLCAAVKANAYGHGIEQVLPVLMAQGVERVAVANLPEALQVRQLGWIRPVLCLGAILAVESAADRQQRADAALMADLNCTITTLDEALYLSVQSARWGRSARVEVKVDTGMGRGGVGWEEAAALVCKVAALPGLVVEGVYSHLATADDPDLGFAHQQLENLASVRTALTQRGVRVGSYHAANSAAVFRLPGAHLDIARPGLAMYGYWGGPDHARPGDLRPVMRVVGQVSAVRQLPAGHTVGYGRTFETARESILGLVPIGYADGYRRALSNQASMTLEAVRNLPARMVPVVGRVSMDQTIVDLTDAGEVRAGDRIVIIDDDPAAPHSVESLARKLQTIPYEITCLLGNRVTRTLV